MPANEKSRARRGGGKLFRFIALAGAAGLAAWGVAKMKGRTGGDDAPANAAAAGGTWLVQRGPMTISVLAPGSLSAKETTTVKNQVSGNVKIIWVVDEGKMVKKGDKLIELEAEGLAERVTRERLSLNANKATTEQCFGDVELQKSQNRTDLLVAQNKLALAKLDLEKYNKGDYEQEKRLRTTAATLAEAELKRADDKLAGTKKLLDKGYVNKGELEADTLSQTKCKLELEKAKEELRLLDTYEKPRQVSMLGTALKEAEEDLARVQKSNENTLRTKQVTADAAKSQEDLQKKAVEDAERDQKNCLVFAPQDGMVVYSRDNWRDDIQIQTGAAVNMMQNLIELPNFASWQTKVRVHESLVQQIKEGQKVFVTLDAFPDAGIEGKVSKVAVMPNAGNWNRQDVKEYSVDVDLGDTKLPLKPGMTTKNEIVINTVAEALLAPLQAVVMEDGKSRVRMSDGVMRDVKVAGNNDRFVEIKEGLNPGDSIYLLPGGSSPASVMDRPSDKGDKKKRGNDDKPGAAKPAEAAAVKPAAAGG